MITLKSGSGSKYKFEIHLHRDGIEFGEDLYESNWYYLYWWNWLHPLDRRWGYAKSWHDGPISLIYWWFGNISWTMPWTNHDGGRIDWDKARSVGNG